MLHKMLLPFCLAFFSEGKTLKSKNQVSTQAIENDTINST
jgi:hypothetical protein